MKRIRVVCVLVMMSLAAAAQTAPPKRQRPKKAANPSAVTAEEIRALRDTLAAQQAEIQQLRDELRQRDGQWQQLQQQLQAKMATPDENRAKAYEIAVNGQPQVVAQLKTDVADVQNTLTNTALGTQEEQARVSALEALLGRFRLNGDARVRYENFFQTGSADRHRERIRLRLGFEGKLSEDFTAGMYLASGALTDPTSTNESLTNVFERKNIAWDRGWITFQPRAAKWLQLTGGKFAFTWQRTPQSFDSDLNPEGFSEKLSFDLAHSLLKNVSLTGMQLFFNENSRGTDAFAAGGQVAAKLALGKRVTVAPSFSLLNWRNNDVILNEPAAVTGASAIQCTLVAGAPSCSVPNGIFAPNGMTNALVTAGGARQFASKFLYADTILDTTIKTAWSRFPVRLLLEYENNLRAATNASHVYLADLSLGQLKDKNDLQFGYGFWRQEQDSTIASFVESDQRAPTNVLQHRLFALWQVRKNTTAGYTLWIGRTLNSSLQNAVLAPGVLPGQVEPYLKRMQFDVIYKF